MDVRVPDRELNPEEERELNLRLNRNSGEWDFTKLSDFDEEMLLDVGFSANELDDIFDLEPAEPATEPQEPPQETFVKLGDIFILGEHRLMCGDSTNADHVNALFRQDRAQMVFTDPPYNVDYKGKGKNTSNGIENDHLSTEDFHVFVKAAFENMHSIMEPGAVFYICSGWSSYSTFENALKESGFYRAGVIIWEKDNGAMGFNDYRYKHEWIVVGKKKDVRQKAVGILYGWKEGSHYFRDTRDELDVWQVPRKHAGAYKHPTEKPIWLVEKAMANSSQRGFIVADLFGGSGSTLIAAERLKRKARIMEYDPIYVQVQIERWTKFTGHAVEKENP